MAYSCPRCGSGKIIPNQPFMDHRGAGGLPAQMDLTIAGQPDAWVFNDKATGKIRANICGECGHLDLYVSNYRELHEKYEKSRSSAQHEPDKE